MSEANEQRVAVVTGASRGIGAAISRRLARDGRRVVLMSRSQGPLDELANEITSAGGAAHALAVDVGDSEAFAGAIESVAKDHGRLDVLVNNAGITRDQILMRMSEEDFDTVVDVNLKGTWNFIKACTRPLMKGAGRIINIASVVGITGNAGQANYAASKAGVLGLTRSVAKELAGRSVCVNAIAPGFIDTDMTQAIDEAARKTLLESIPLDRMGAVDEIAAAVAFLAGPAGGYITGQTLVIDGGLSL